MRRRRQPEASRPAIPNVAPGESTSAASLPELAEYFTPAEVSKRLKISTKQVIRFFEGRAGVLNLGGERRPTRTDKRSKYSILRISYLALMQFLAEHQA
ncbi:MAG: hypothetical protein WB711_15715 [Terriglobales bacterium]